MLPFRQVTVGAFVYPDGADLDRNAEILVDVLADYRDEDVGAGGKPVVKPQAVGPQSVIVLQVRRVKVGVE